MPVHGTFPVVITRFKCNAELLQNSCLPKIKRRLAPLFPRPENTIVVVLNLPLQSKPESHLEMRAQLTTSISGRAGALKCEIAASVISNTCQNLNSSRTVIQLANDSEKARILAFHFSTTRRDV